MKKAVAFIFSLIFGLPLQQLANMLGSAKQIKKDNK